MNGGTKMTDESKILIERYNETKSIEEQLEILRTLHNLLIKERQDETSKHIKGVNLR
jgi:hypothetical protein